MSDVNRLMADAQKQLEEHQLWLMKEIERWSASIGPGHTDEQFKQIGRLHQQASEIKLRMSRADEGKISILWEYPDELAAWLRSDAAPEHLRKSITEGRAVDMNQPGFTAKRVPS
jgi:hypothetical protein